MLFRYDLAADNTDILDQSLPTLFDGASSFENETGRYATMSVLSHLEEQHRIKDANMESAVT